MDVALMHVRHPVLICRTGLGREAHLPQAELYQVVSEVFTLPVTYNQLHHHTVNTTP
jgi:hypothetical protein